MRTIYGDTIYSGSLKKEILTGAEKRMSFLAGTYLRYGQLMDEKDAQELFGEDFGPDFKCISIANSRSKAQLCKDLLLAEGCKEVKYLVAKNYIPTGHWIFFKPSKAVLEMIDRVTALKKTWE